MVFKIETMHMFLNQLRCDLTVRSVDGQNFATNEFFRSSTLIGFQMGCISSDYGVP
jgi:hypothetical protein